MFVPTKPVCCGGARYLVGIIGDDGFARPLLGAEIKEVCRLLNAKPALGERSEPALSLLGEAARTEKAASQCEFAADALHKAGQYLDGELQSETHTTERMLRRAAEEWRAAKTEAV